MKARDTHDELPTLPTQLPCDIGMAPYAVQRCLRAGDLSIVLNQQRAPDTMSLRRVASEAACH